MDRWPVRGTRTVPVVEASCDYLGINHYYGQEVAFDITRPRDHLMRRITPKDAYVGEFGLPLKPEWLYDAVLSVKHLGKPIYITESGIAATDDAVREDFILRNLEQLRRAIGDGADVRGYFHWTSVDNFEWAFGYSMKFGLIAIDRYTLERSPKPSAHLYARIAAGNALPSGADRAGSVDSR